MHSYVCTYTTVPPCQVYVLLGDHGCLSLRILADRLRGGVAVSADGCSINGRELQSILGSHSILVRNWFA